MTNMRESQNTGLKFMYPFWESICISCHVCLWRHHFISYLNRSDSPFEISSEKYHIFFELRYLSLVRGVETRHLRGWSISTATTTQLGKTASLCGFGYDMIALLTVYDF